jgi:D-aspartate ligase
MGHACILIPDGDDPRVLAVVDSLKHRTSVDFRLHTIVNNRRRRKIILSRRCTCHSFDMPQDDVQALYEAVSTVAESTTVDVLLPLAETGARLVAAKRDLLQQRFKLPAVPDLASLELVSNKCSLTEFARRHGVATPATVFVKHGSPMEQAVLNMAFPVLMKPLTGTDGQGISRFDSAQSLKDELARPAGELYQQGGLVQEFLTGSDIDMSVLCQDGEILAYTIQKKLASYDTPFRLGKVIEFIDHEEVLLNGRRLLRALNWSGVAHLDFVCRTKDGDPCLIDFNPRYWGTLCGSVLAGVNFPFLHYLTALGNWFPRPEYRHSKYGELSLQEILLKPFLRSEVGRVSLTHESNFPFVCRDPLPFLATSGRDMLSAIFKK